MNATLEVLADRACFRKKRAEAWDRNVPYWLRGPLRHVADVGDFIAERTIDIARTVTSHDARVVDMGCGDAWLLRKFLERRARITYVGIDCTTQFVDRGREVYEDASGSSFKFVDLELPSQETFNADIVVNAFNFFELCDLDSGFAHAAQALKPGGTLLMSTIDKTYLLLALSHGWDDFKRILALYESLPGLKYAFQPIDLGDKASESLVYPSVFYSTEHYLNAASTHGFSLQNYTESVFTAKPIPKIYCHLEFRKIQG